MIAWACAWVDRPDDVFSEALPVRNWHNNRMRSRFVKPLLELIAEADVVTGHNIRRFDLPILQTEAMRLGLDRIGPKLTQDTIVFPRTKGFKKGLDNLGVLLQVKTLKKGLNWQEWQDAYGEKGMTTVLERVIGDVVMHMELRHKMRERGWLRSPAMWRP